MSLSVPRKPLFIVSCGAMFVFGMIVAMLGTLFGLPEMRERLAIDFAQQGELFSLLFIGLIAATVVGGPTLDRFGSKPVLVGAAGSVTAALLLFGAARGFGLAGTAAVLLGLGGGWLNIGANAMVSDLYPEDRGRRLNLVGMFFGVGALFVPLLVSLTFGVLSITGTLLVCAAVAAACTFAGASLRFPPARESATFSFRDLWRAGREPGVFLLAMLLFFQSGNEGTLSGWTTTYIGSVGWSPRAATVILLGYWVMAIIGRSVSARLQATVGKERLVVGAGVLAAAGCAILLLGAGSLSVLTIGAWVTALALSPVFPTTLAIAGDRYHRFAGTVFGFLFTISNFGGMSFAWFLGQVSETAGVRMGMLVPLAGTIAVTLCALVVLRRSKTGVA